MLTTIMNDRSEASHPDLAERIRHACAYPFARPACSYLFKGGGMQPLSPGATEGRIPVLASGSNAAPLRLAAKFGGDDDAIPVTRAVLHDFAVVFAGHFTGYGAIPATLAPQPGARTKIWITWLTPSQRAIMHRSEGVIGCREMEQRYDYIELRDLVLHPERMPAIDQAGAYLARRMLAPGGEPIRFAEVFSESCSLTALPEHAILRLAHRLLEPTTGFSRFMSRVLSGPEQRQTLFRALAGHTIGRESD